MSGRNDFIETLQKTLGYRFKDVSILREAMTHSSYRNEHGDIDYDNERLEFLGDAVIGVVVSHFLWESFSGAAEGILTRYRSQLVSEGGLSQCALKLDLGEYLLLGHGEETSGGRNKSSILADVFEALMAAVYLDGGYEEVVRLIREVMGERLTEVGGAEEEDFKTRVQEEVQAKLHTIPRYRVDEESGPDHLKEFRVSLMLEGRPFATGHGRSKKEAEQNAAQSLMEQLSAEEGMLDRLLKELDS